MGTAETCPDFEAEELLCQEVGDHDGDHDNATGGRMDIEQHHNGVYAECWGLQFHPAKTLPSLTLMRDHQIPTPLRLTYKWPSTSQEKKQEGQVEQGNQMIRNQGKDIKKKGGGVGAAVTVIPDHRSVSHRVRIVGIIYKMKRTGGAQVANTAGLLVQSATKDFWIPGDQYLVRYKPNKVWHLQHNH
jgi:hypothetical protein